MTARLSPQKIACIVAAICLYAIVAWIYAPVVSDHPYGYDEADYMFAGQQGLWANYSGKNTLSFVEFVKKGLELSHDSGKRQSLSEYIRSIGDVDFYRHFHGPMYVYWIALVRDAGARRENVFRGSGLLIHFAAAMLILFGIWAMFPSLPPIAALLACALFVFDRAALTAAAFITQHVLFTFFCIVSLTACSMFLRNLEEKWFYASIALISCAVCTVETSVLILGALGLSMLVEHRRVREKWPTLRVFAGLILRGIGVVVLTMLICWPMGVLKLGIAKGFLQQVYIAVYRKTFSPLGPLGLWETEFRVSPAEFSVLVAGAIMAFILWRRFAQRRELLPWLAFIVVFVLVTLKVTVPYTYYYAPLTAAFSVATGTSIGILWRRWPWLGRCGLLLVVTAGIIVMTIPFRQGLRDLKNSRPYESVVLQTVDRHPIEAGRQLYLPYQLVPMMHYYRPDIKTTGYDVDAPLPRLADGIRSQDSANIMFCEKNFCDGLEHQAPGLVVRKTLLDRPGPNGQPFYVLEIGKS